MSIYTPSTNRRPPSPIARMHAARDAAEARLADKNDPEKILVRRVRASVMGLNDARRVASERWQRDNDAIPLPPGLGILVHPQRAKALRKLMADLGWSDDSFAPIEPTPTRAEHVARATAEAQAELDAANADVAAFYAERDASPVSEDADAVAMPVPALTPKRGPGRPPKVRAIDITALENE